MVDTTLWLAEFKTLKVTDWPAYLNERSGLPGPRANIELIAVAARAADPDTIEELLADDGEYTTACAAAALGYRAADEEYERRARQLATDERWRVREAVTIGLQLLGDSDLQTLFSLVRSWADDEDPLVQRAAAVAICEPRLLRTAEGARIAVEVCQRTTDHLTALSAQDRKAPAARTLRKSLGYCWSVAVAADPGAGLPVFAALDTSDPDLAWIVTQNRRKKRLSKLLDNPA